MCKFYLAGPKKLLLLANIALLWQHFLFSPVFILGFPLSFVFVSVWAWLHGALTTYTWAHLFFVFFLAEFSN